MVRWFSEFENYLNLIIFFSLLVKKSKLRGIKNIGTYYYDDSKNKKNGEFDVVLELDDGYAIYEVKYLTGKMSVSNVNKEIEQINNINGIRVFKIGFINPNGFEKEIENIDFIENIYNIWPLGACILENKANIREITVCKNTLYALLHWKQRIPKCSMMINWLSKLW